MGAGSRRDARERAIGLLYEAEMRGARVADVVAELPVEPDPYASEISLGAERDHERIEELIRRYLRPDWPWERVALVDRIVLRLGCYELLDCPDVPTAVILSEAVELAQRYGTDDSGRFVNGLLARVAAEVRATTSS